MTLTVDFTANPQGIVASSGTTQVRFWDKSITDNGVVNSWIWLAGTYKYVTFTSGSPNLGLTNANLYFYVNQPVLLHGTIGAGFTEDAQYYVVASTSTYVQLSATIGGSPISAGSTYAFNPLYNGSRQQNPIIPFFNTSAGTIDVALVCNDSGGTGATTTTKTGYINAVTYSFSKPANAGIYGRITIFIYDSTNATAINRVKSTNNNLFFQSLKCSDSITKAGTASFTVYNAGGATATEKGLMVADKNVAIISGRDVIWSGKISRAIQSKMSLYDTSSPFMSWEVECESDVSKMRYQNVLAANQIAYNAPPGYIINKLIEPAVATDIDWRGVVNPSLISYEGANIQYTITSADMYTQFLTLANLTGFDWRTRNDWMKYAYGASGYDSSAKTVTVSAISPYTTNEFAGMWLLFVSATDTGGATNNVGIKAYGNIASNTTTVITMTSITNASTPPASSDYVIILGNPVLDFSSDFRQPTYVSTFTCNKARASTLQNGYEMNDKSDFKQVITKVIAKGKDSLTNNTFAFSLAAPTVWDNTKTQFTDTTYITFRTDAYLYLAPVAADLSHFYADGWGLAWKVGESVFIIQKNDQSIAYFTWTIVALSENMLAGKKVTYVTINTLGALPAIDLVGALCCNQRFYVKNKSDAGWVAGGPYPAIKIGTEIIYTNSSSGTDTVYGDFLSYSVDSVLYYRDSEDNNVQPHFPGALVWKNTSYDETTPATGSPLDYFGLIGKTLTADQQTTGSDLEVYATNHLINHSFYYRKGTFWAFVYDWFKPDVRQTNEVSENGWLRAGDEICILQTTGDLPTTEEYGQYKNQWQVVGWTLDADQMIVSAELGDFERNTNTLINDKTSGINYTIT